MYDINKFYSKQNSTVINDNELRNFIDTSLYEAFQCIKDSFHCEQTVLIMIEINVRELKYRIALKNTIYFVLDMASG